MKGASLLETMNQLGVKSSYSRPRVSNDNAFAESIFKTCKYRPEYPEKGFLNLHKARSWVHNFVQCYNYEHQHSGINFVTPHARHEGVDKTLLANRDHVYEMARQANPRRWSKNTRNWQWQDVVYLNPEISQVH